MKGTTVLYGPMTHPQFLRALATAGHGSKILLADANYPHKTGVGPSCELVSLNYAPGMLDVIEVLRVLKRTIPIESVEIMVPDPTAEPVGIPIHDEFKEEFGIEELPDEDHDHFQTLGGFVTAQIGRIPAVGETCDWNGFTFEVRRMDRARVAEIRMTRAEYGMDDERDSQ